jgi:DNA-directed RNA polymerase specialized sigma24 family protein
MTERSLPRETRRVLTQAAFDELLAAFDADRDRAGEKYEAMRAKLVTFFENRGGAAPEEMADDALTRVATRIAEGVSVPPAELHSYVYGVARNVLREGWQTKTKLESLEDLAPSRHPSVDPRQSEGPDWERRLECLGRCVAKLEPEERDLVARYHSGEGRERIEGRRALAERFNSSANALRVRVHRIHRELESCLEACLRRGKE